MKKWHLLYKDKINLIVIYISERGFLIEDDIVTHISYGKVEDLIRWIDEIEEILKKKF